VTFNGLQLAMGSLLLCVVAWAVYWPLIAKMRVPRRPRGTQLVMALSIALALAAFFREPGIAGGVIGSVAILVAGMFFF
jgi:hypothetical protein